MLAFKKNDVRKWQFKQNHNIKNDSDKMKKIKAMIFDDRTNGGQNHWNKRYDHVNETMTDNDLILGL